MTKSVFRISYDDAVKLNAIISTLGKPEFTALLAREHNLGISQGDIQRWNGYTFIECVGKTRHGKWGTKVSIWKITDRVIKRLSQPKRGTKP